MFAIAFDLVVADTERHNPKGISKPYADIGESFCGYGFRRVQSSLYVTDNEDMANLVIGHPGAAVETLIPAIDAGYPGFSYRAMVGFCHLVKAG